MSGRHLQLDAYAGDLLAELGLVQPHGADGGEPAVDEEERRVVSSHLRKVIEAERIRIALEVASQTERSPDDWLETFGGGA